MARGRTRSKAPPLLLGVRRLFTVAASARARSARRDLDARRAGCLPSAPRSTSAAADPPRLSAGRAHREPAPLTLVSVEIAAASRLELAPRCRARLSSGRDRSRRGASLRPACLRQRAVRLPNVFHRQGLNYSSRQPPRDAARTASRWRRTLSIESPRGPASSSAPSFTRRGGARSIHRGAVRSCELTDETRKMRPIDFCKPTRTNQALCGSFDSLFSERRARFDAASLASVIAFVLHRDLP